MLAAAAELAHPNRTSAISLLTIYLKMNIAHGSSGLQTEVLPVQSQQRPGRAWSPARQGRGACGSSGPRCQLGAPRQSGSWPLWLRLDAKCFTPAGLRHCAHSPKGTTRAKQPPDITQLPQWLFKGTERFRIEARSGGGAGSVRVAEGGTHKVKRGQELQVYDYSC